MISVKNAASFMRREVDRRFYLSFAVTLALVGGYWLPLQIIPERGRQPEGWVEKTLKTLSLEEKVGQMIQVRYYADKPDSPNPEYDSTLAVLI